MRAVVGIAEAIVLIKVLERADEPRVVHAHRVIGLGFEKTRKGVRQPLVFEHHAAGHEIPILGRLVGAQPEQNLIARIADDEIDGDERRQADDGAEIVVV
ncbi:MAG: hypothetical protein WCD69_04585 [Xanthobacteraceae bacterium]